MTNDSQNISPVQDQEEYWNCLSFGLNKGYYALIDIEDYEFACHKKWNAEITKHGKVYAKGSFVINGRARTKAFHQFICPVEPGKQVDHINGNSLDNRRKNLRAATPAENTRNRAPNKVRRHTQFKGVQFIRGMTTKKIWEARLIHKNKKIYLGRFETEVEAAIAFNEAAKKYHGEFAYLNKVFMPLPPAPNHTQKD